MTGGCFQCVLCLNVRNFAQSGNLLHFACAIYMKSTSEFEAGSDREKGLGKKKGEKILNKRKTVFGQ